MGDVLDLRIRPGMSESRDARMLPIADGVATPRLLQNVRFRQLDRAEKRPGTATLGTTGLPTAASGLWTGGWGTLPAAACEEDQGAQSGPCAYVRDTEGRWNPIGRHGYIVPERRFGVAQYQGSSAVVRGASCVAVNGLIYVAWGLTSGTVCIAAIDPSGTIMRESTLTDAANPRLVYDGANLRLVWRQVSSGGTDIKVGIVLSTTTVVAGGTSIGTLAASTDIHDVAPLESGASGTWLLAYPEDATHIRVKVVNATTATSSETIVTTSAATHVGITGQAGNKVVVTYIDGTAAEVCTFSDTLTGAANVTVHTAAGNEAWGSAQTSSVRVDTATWHLVFPGSDSTASPLLSAQTFYHARCNASGVVATGPYKVFHAGPCSKVFAVGEKACVLVGTQTTGENEAHFFLDLEYIGSTGGGAQVSAWSFEHVALIGSANVGSVLPEVADLGSGRRCVPAHWMDPGEPYERNGVDALVFRASTAAQSMTWASRHVLGAGVPLIVSGGVLYEHTSVATSSFQSGDSYYIVENGFVMPPKFSVDETNGGSLTADQEYTFFCMYAWTDPHGRVHRSAPSDHQTATPTGTDLTVTLRIATLPASGRFGKAGGEVVAEVYVSWLGGPFYLAGKTGSVIGSALSVTFAHSATDAATEDNAPPYTDGTPGQVLPNFPPSGARLVCEWGVRLATVGWRENVVQVSKVFIATAPWEFCDDASHEVEVQPRITALGYMDGAGVIFCADRIFIVAGSGPTDQGGGGFGDPQTLPATVGADAPHVVEVPQGLIYKGAGTLWLLPRGFGPPQPVGDDIQETLASFPHLRGAVRCANGDDDCTHFVLASSDLPAATTKVAVWDNRLGAWSLDDIEGEVGAAGCVDGKFTWLLPTWDAAADVPVRQFSTASTQDLAANNGTATWIESRIGLGDLRLFGALGWGVLRRFMMLLEAAARCIVKLDVSVDHANATTFIKTYAAASGPKYLESEAGAIKGTAFRFDMYDAEDSGKTAGAIWHAFAVEAQAEKGLRRDLERMT